MYKVIVIVFLAISCHYASVAQGQEARIAPAVLEALDSEPTVDIVLALRQSTSSVLNQINQKSFASRGDRITTLASALQNFTASSQKYVTDFLISENKNFKSFWISNRILVEDAHLDLVRALSVLEDIEAIRDNKIVLDPREESFPASPLDAANEVQWGVEKIEAPAAWALGFTGRGVVVGMLDTGVRLSHETLTANYRENRGWIDVYRGHPTPRDLDGHGTHVMGTILGRGGIGVAPEAQWIACGASLSGYDEYLECGQFFLCPTHADGTEPDCTVAPHIISNSWGKTPGDDENFLDDTIKAWNAAGIIPVWSGGNSGPDCATNGYPAETSLDLIATGASDSNDLLAYFSSRGPGRQESVRPDITAPGVSIVSADFLSDTGLSTKSGTSMAAPHVAGVVALLYTNGTELTFSEVKSILAQSALHTIPETCHLPCGGAPQTEYPNNHVGYGRLSALGAVSQLIARREL